MARCSFFAHITEDSSYFPAGFQPWDRIAQEGYDYLGDYDNGRDELSQKIQVGDSARLSYDIKIETNELRHPSDHLLVRLTNGAGEQLAVLQRYSDADAGGSRHETAELSDFAGRTVYVSFLVNTDPNLRTAFYLDKVSLEAGDSQSTPRND